MNTGFPLFAILLLQNILGYMAHLCVETKNFLSRRSFNDTGRVLSSGYLGISL